MATAKPTRLVIDPNVIGSVLLGGITRTRYVQLLDHLDRYDICYCERLLQEILHFEEVSYFRQKGITVETLRAFTTSFQGYALKVNVTSAVRLGRDRNDYYLLSLCRDARATYLITGDPDLLLLKSYGRTQIISMKMFGELMP